MIDEDSIVNCKENMKIVHQQVINSRSYQSLRHSPSFSWCKCSKLDRFWYSCNEWSTRLSIISSFMNSKNIDAEDRGNGIHKPPMLELFAKIGHDSGKIFVKNGFYLATPFNSICPYAYDMNMISMKNSVTSAKTFRRVKKQPPVRKLTAL